MAIIQAWPRIWTRYYREQIQLAVRSELELTSPAQHLLDHAASHEDVVNTAHYWKKKQQQLEQNKTKRKTTITTKNIPGSTSGDLFLLWVFVGYLISSSGTSLLRFWEPKDKRASVLVLKHVLVYNLQVLNLIIIIVR